MTDSSSPIKVYLVDDHQIILDGLTALLKEIPDIEVIGEANSGTELLHRLAWQSPDIIIIDVDMPQMDGKEATLQVKKKHPDVQLIALSMHHDHGIIQAMTRAGASGYLLKNTSQEEMITAIRKVYQGGTYFSSELAQSLLQQHSTPSPTPISPAILTKREREILQLIAEGCSNTEIGAQLHISHRTVDTHRTNLMRKLEVKNIAGLIRFAFRHGLVK
ncbi:MAG: response regulator transcription factor [Bacteroidota bacterium]